MPTRTVAVAVMQLHHGRLVTVRFPAKASPTFADAEAAVRQALWEGLRDGFDEAGLLAVGRRGQVRIPRQGLGESDVLLSSLDERGGFLGLLAHETAVQYSGDPMAALLEVQTQVTHAAGVAESTG